MFFFSSFHADVSMYRYIYKKKKKTEEEEKLEQEKEMEREKKTSAMTPSLFEDKKIEGHITVVV